MIRNLLFIAAICLSGLANAQQASYNDRVQQYIARYREFAEMEQQRVGIPAAITLGQGILETQAGLSELATIANNHFGIKCKKEWKGETFAHDDDAPQECFRKYPSALHSYKDHSDYLKTSVRYNSCFACGPTDYAAWAKELRKCGYATNPNYAKQLIKIIEDFQLQDYTYAAMEHKQPALIASAASPVEVAIMADKSNPGEAIPEHDTPVTTARAEKPVYGKATHKDGIRGFYAHKGDVLLEYAIQYKVRYAKLLEINHLPDAPLASDMFVALEKGSRVTQILSRDISDATVPSAASAIAVQPKQEALASKEPVPGNTPREIPESEKNEPVINALDIPAKPASAAPSQEIAAEKARVEATQPVPVSTAGQIPELSEKPIAIASGPVVSNTTGQSSAPAEKPINIANEVAVEEMKPAVKAEEPKDEFSRLKARFDRVVYAAPTPKAQPATTAAVTPPKEEPINTPRVVVASAATTSAAEFHVVQKGETAFGIAKRYNISMKELMSMNKLDFEAIKVGQKLRVK